MHARAPLSTYLLPTFDHARARDAMRPWVATAGTSTPLVTAAQRMAGEQIHAIVVLGPPERDRARRPWTVLTDRDVLREAIRAEDLTAGEAAAGEVVEVHPDDPLADVAARMAEHGVTHVVVVESEKDLPVGIISTLDIARIVGWGRA
jgi:CBS domain-containing protein